MTTELTPKQILERLISFPTVSQESNLPLIDWVESYLQQWQIETHRVPNADGTKASLYAIAGPKVAGGVALSGHTDVVPVDGQDWSSLPFELVEKDGRYYGRGTADMKGFVALAIAATVQAACADVKRPLYLALSYDEEIGCMGCIDMVKEMTATLPHPQAVIVGEPSSLKVIDGHKGGSAFQITIKGVSVHSSLMHTGVSAIMEGAKLIDWCNRVNDENRQKTPGPLSAKFIPHWTTAHVGIIAGGTAHNITAGECTFDVGFRVIPDEDIDDWKTKLYDQVDALRAHIQSVSPDADITIEPQFLLPPLKPEFGGPAEVFAKRITGQNDSDVVSYGTEGGHFQANGWSCVVCGPGNIEQAHKPDEFIEISQFEAGKSMLDNVVTSLKQ